jgi:thiaminase/transcriptional activator TenA
MNEKTLFAEMRYAVNQTMQAIYHHPFNLELSEGTLPREKFIFYLIQDAFYLAEYARALALVASRLSAHDHMQQFMRFALDALQAERDLHVNYLEKNQIYLNDYQPNPTCFMYTNYLLKTASLASIEEGVASLLPCFWVYREVGKKMQNLQTQQINPYRDWIDMYSGLEFDAAVERALTVMNQLGSEASASLKEKMLTAFVKATELEWLFWDSAYRQETWLVTAGFSTNPIVSESISS